MLSPLFGRGGLSDDQINDHENQGHDIGSDAGIIQGPGLSCLVSSQLLILMNVLDDVQSKQGVIDFDSPLGEIPDDHHGKDDTQAHRHERKNQE